MKKINIAFLLVIILHLSCVSGNYWKLRVEVPRGASLDIDGFKEIVITSFLVEKKTKDFNLNQELIDYFSFELGKHFKGKIITKEISWEKAENLKKEDFWKKLLPESKEALVLTGSVQYSQEVRKAILEKYTDYSREFSAEKGLAQRKFFTLVLHLYLIKAKTGEILYERDFKESKGYQNPKQTANFAFFDLIEQVRMKLFRKILGEERVEQRYLISD